MKKLILVKIKKKNSDYVDVVYVTPEFLDCFNELAEKYEATIYSEEMVEVEVY